MSKLIEPSALWQALQDVDDGQEPHDVYARVLSEAIHPEEAIEDDYPDMIAEAHDRDSCRGKHEDGGHCMGSECFTYAPNIRIMRQCPCKCHAGEWD